ncbi:hypothetical protein [Tahibacter amnicola]|uniref:SnoaL-like protein n=1 Tax=Tahibacter amnicola TaxID=2976241 RepID=A0ABY6B8J3_9GAMM|nr:hypothetical protein [Tahibacter amnicola]UXI66398.1 hypothetical protein N4264_16775 [Tahibacter amnicola]
MRRLPNVVIGTSAVTCVAVLGLWIWLSAKDDGWQARVTPATAADSVPVAQHAEPAGEVLPRAVPTVRSALAAAAIGLEVEALPVRVSDIALSGAPTLQVLQQVGAGNESVSARPAVEAVVAEPLARATEVQAMPGSASSGAGPPRYRGPPAGLPSEVPLPSRLSEAEVRAWQERFQQLYSSDNVDDFLSLFSEDVEANEGGIERIRTDYRRLFERSEPRRLTLSGMQWEIAADSAIGRGRYEAVVGARDANAKPVTGAIVLGLRRTGGNLRITKLQHNVSGHRG